MAQEIKHFIDEPDIGSGERGPGQEDVDRDVRSVFGTAPAKPLDGSQLHQVVEEQEYGNRYPADTESSVTPGEMPSYNGRILQSGTHMARVSVRPLPDGTFEAQVFVRLSREPEIAETFIPAGILPTEDEAWAAAEARAKRALDEQEF